MSENLRAFKIVERVALVATVLLLVGIAVLTCGCCSLCPAKCTVCPPPPPPTIITVTKVIKEPCPPPPVIPSPQLRLPLVDETTTDEHTLFLLVAEDYKELWLAYRDAVELLEAYRAEVESRVLPPP